MSFKNVSDGLEYSGYSSQSLVTRPADTVAYTAGDVVGATAAAIEFAGIGSPRTIMRILAADLRIDVASVPAGMTTFRLHLYSVTPPSALADNAAWDLPSGDRDAYLGYIDIGTPIDVGSTLYVITSGIDRDVKMGNTSSLFAYLVTNTGYTPTSASVRAARLYSVSL